MISQLPPLTLLINGQATLPSTFPSDSIFYPEYRIFTPSARRLDVSRAIGAARQANRLPFAERIATLQEAAKAFQGNQALVEHTVRFTGIPSRVVKELLADIPQWLRITANSYQKRFQPGNQYPQFLIDQLSPLHYRILHPLDGFCYAVTPATDPRGSTLAAANLCALGIPFVFKASRGDAVTPELIKALIQSGFDPAGCNLIYFDQHAPEAAQLHQKLIQESTAVWTFGPIPRVQAALGSASKNALFQHNQVLITHEKAACASILQGDFRKETANFLWQSTSFASGCTATRSVMLLQNRNWSSAARDFLANLKVGDPLDPQTEVGFIYPRNLDILQKNLEKFGHWIEIFGGQRLSPQQMTPLFVKLNRSIPEFIGRELPAYLLSILPCLGLEDAVQQLNHSLLEPKRLAVSTYGLEIGSAEF